MIFKKTDIVQKNILRYIMLRKNDRIICMELEGMKETSRRAAEKSRLMMIRFLPHFKEAFHSSPDDPDTGWYGVNACDSWAIQSNYNIAGALAVLAAEPEELPGACMSRDEMRAYALKIFRRNLNLHCSGPASARGGSSWGCTWISVLGLERTFHALDQLMKYLSPAEAASFRKLREAEADFLLSDKYPVVGAIDAYTGCNKPESNIWNGSFLLRSALDFPDHPHASDWRRKGCHLLLNGISIPQDQMSSEKFAGIPLYSWHKGANFTDHFSLDHHAYLNVGYMTICLSNMAYLDHLYRSRGLEAPPETRFHAGDLWLLLRNLIAPDGRLIRIGGDTRSRYTYCQCYLLSVLEFAKTVLQDPCAEELENGYLELLNAEQERNADGGFYSARLDQMRRKSSFYYSRLESDPFCALSFVLACGKTAPSGAVLPPMPEPPAVFTWSDAFHNAAVIRSAQSFRSFVRRGNKGMTALCFPVDRSDFAEWTRNMTGDLLFRGQEEELESCIREFPGGFIADSTGVSYEGMPFGEGETPYPSLDVRFTAAALPDGVSMLCRHRVVTKRDISLNGWNALNLSIPNDLFNGFRRHYAWEGAECECGGETRSDEVLETRGRTLVCDGRLALRALSPHTFKIIRKAEQNVFLNCGLTSLYADTVELDHHVSPELLPEGTVLFDIAWTVSTLPQALKLHGDEPMTASATPSVIGADGAVYRLVWPEDGLAARLLQNEREI